MTRLVFLYDELVTVCRVVNSREVEVFNVLGVVEAMEVMEVVVVVVSVVVRIVIVVDVDLKVVEVVEMVVLIFLSLQPPLTGSNSHGDSVKFLFAPRSLKFLLMTSRAGPELLQPLQDLGLVLELVK